MDLGGGSTQIVFEPSLPIAEGDHKVNITLQNKSYVLYQRSYLGYGLVEGRKKSLAKGGCSHQMESHTCLKVISSSFDKNEACSLPPCSFNGFYMPHLEETFYDGDIYAFSYFYDIFAEPFGKVESGFKVGQIREAASTKCTEKPEEDTCLDLGFIYSLLRTGYDLPNSRILKTAKKINGIETGWCLGAALAML
jgi:guanosine-diphosphatase